MEELAVVYFYVKKEMCGKRRKKDPWQYEVSEERFFSEAGEVSIFHVAIPGFYRKKKPWTEALYEEYVSGMPVPEESILTVHLREGYASVLSFEWLTFLLRYFSIAFDGLVILEDRELEPLEWIMPYLHKVHFMGVVTTDPERYEDVAEELMEEYGFLLEVAGTYEELTIPQGLQVLFVAGRELYGVKPHMIPRDSAWLDAGAGGSTLRQLCMRASNAQYFCLQRFLKGTEKRAGRAEGHVHLDT